MAGNGPCSNTSIKIGIDTYSDQYSSLSDNQNCVIRSEYSMPPAPAIYRQKDRQDFMTKTNITSQIQSSSAKGDLQQFQAAQRRHTIDVLYASEISVPANRLRTISNPDSTTLLQQALQQGKTP